MLERSEIKTAIDIVDQWEDDQAGQVAAILMRCGNEIAQLRAELAALKAENENLRKDAARLDWVEHKDFDDLSFTVLVDQPNDGMTAVSIGAGWHLGNNLRAAIDVAMAQGEKN